MTILTSVLISMLNAYILYSIFKTRGFNYALVFSFVWDMLYFTKDFYGTGIPLTNGIVLVIILAIECFVKIKVDYFVFKKTNKFIYFFILSFILESLILSFTNNILVLIINLIS